MLFLPTRLTDHCSLPSFGDFALAFDPLSLCHAWWNTNMSNTDGQSTAIMPFGKPSGGPGKPGSTKQFKPLEDRVLVFTE